MDMHQVVCVNQYLAIQTEYYLQFFIPQFILYIALGTVMFVPYMSITVAV